MKQICSILIGFLHDFAVGCWAATVFAVYWLDRGEFGAGIANLLFDLKKQFFFLGLFCIGVVLLSGVGRSFTYVSNVYGKNVEKRRRLMLFIKHLVLFSVFGIGTYWQYVTIFR